MQYAQHTWQAKNCNIFYTDDSRAGTRSIDLVTLPVSCGRTDVDRARHSACATFAWYSHLTQSNTAVCIQHWMFDVSSPQGRVAESGLRHSTRNRAWGDPPWVRIPPLPLNGLVSNNTINVSCLGEIFDCDFSQMLKMQWCGADAHGLHLRNSAPPKSKIGKSREPATIVSAALV
jgi:hypothetical protein